MWVSLCIGFIIPFVGIAILFQHTQNVKSDSYIGELSYPMYICHIPILWIAGHLVAVENMIYIVIPMTIGMSMLLSRVQSYIDDYRHHFIIKNPKL